MLETAIKLLDKIEQAGFKAYIVGGFVRDHIIGLPSTDIDIATSATPMDIKNIFKESCLPHEAYGSVTVVYKNIRFEITTFRKESAYLDNRRPSQVSYITDLKEDLKRRDFTMNTLCMDKNGDIFDYFNGCDDIAKKQIQTVGNSKERFSEDVLRILRAVRFSTILGFTLTDEVISGISETKHLLKNLSYDRKREELDKIFTSHHVKEGIYLLLALGLDEALELSNLRDVTVYDDLLGIWSCLDAVDKYPFTTNEKELITRIQEASLVNNFDPIILYHYGLYVNVVAAAKKGFDKRQVTVAYQQLPIQTRKDIDITTKEIIDLLGKEPGPYLKAIYHDLEQVILNSELDNKKDDIILYLRNKYI